ncbi:MAG TPA: class I SAM-dependent methyltransferase [Anaerolineales bacterium]|nr:class I SAM-dependent methyltransferase [Anaerolineales bacterium]
MSHQHAETNASHAHKITIRNKLFAGFLQHMHDTELWASHIPRVPKGLYFLAAAGFALDIASFTTLLPDSAPLKFSTLTLGFLLVLPALLAYNFAQRKWTYASRIRAQIFDSLALRGDEKILDVGCGSGLLLNEAANRLTDGKATGIDIWASHTGGGNYDLLMKNAKAEGVADKIEFKQADVRNLPFEDASFDVIVSSGALHHISHEMPDHEKALNEMTRVLKPGGRIVLWDTTHMVKGYASRMQSAGITSEVKETMNSPFGFEMSVMTGQKGR